MKALLYCCKNKPYINKRGDDITNYPDYVFDCEGVNGTIVAECDFEIEKVIKIYKGLGRHCYISESLNECELYKKSLVTIKEMNNYLQDHNYEGYAIHIKNLHIFDEPKSLRNYGKKDEKIGDTQYFKVVDKAPQNMMYVIDEQGNKYVLISIRPEWLCKILNGEKKIEIRRKVLKEMEK